MINILFFTFLSFKAFAGPAILLEDGDSIRESTIEMSSKSVLDLRDHRRVGLGVQGAGVLGMAGALIELNFSSDRAAVVGFGGGDGYRAISFSWKGLLTESTLSSYLLFGYSRRDGFRRKEEVRFGQDYIFPAIGAQFYQLKGNYAGLSVFAEIQLMTNLESFNISPTGSLGSIFYF